MGYPKGQGPIRSEANAKEGKTANFTPNQIASIRRSPAGKLPRFINVGIGTSKAPGFRSIGANVQVGKKNLGGSLGVNKGKLFGTLNVNHEKAKSFGPKKPSFKGE